MYAFAVWGDQRRSPLHERFEFIADNEYGGRFSAVDISIKFREFGVEMRHRVAENFAITRIAALL